MKMKDLIHIREIVIAIEWKPPLNNHHLDAANNALDRESFKRGGWKVKGEELYVLQELVYEFERHINRANKLRLRAVNG